MTNVPAIRVGGGTAFAGDAIVIGANQIEMENRRRPRAVYIVSDGGWYDTEAGVQKIRWLAELGAPTIHLSIGAEPLSVEASRVCVLTEPADGMELIAQHTVDALTAAHRRRPTTSRSRRDPPARSSARATTRSTHNDHGVTLTHYTLLPEPALFDVTAIAGEQSGGTLERVALEHIELAPNERRDISPESIHTLATMLARTGQLVPCIGYRPRPDEPRVVLCAGQRRLLAARASHELAGTPDFDGLAPVTSLIVLLLDHEPGEDEIRRIQAQENAREPLSLRDQHEQFRDCWQARAGLPDADRMAIFCADLDISAGKGHSLRRQPALPDAIRERIAERPAGDRLSVRIAHRLADSTTSPELTQAVAARVTTSELHDQALRDLGGFVHRTVVEDERV
jgi:hypothetical protein